MHKYLTILTLCIWFAAGFIACMTLNTFAKSEQESYRYPVDTRQQ